MKVELFFVVGHVATGLSLFILLMAFLPYKGRKIESRLIGVSSSISLASHLTIIFIPFHGKQVNLPQNIATLLIFLPLALAYHLILNRRYQTFFSSSTLCFLAFGICNLFFWQKDDYNTYTLAVGSLILIVYCILYLYRLLVDLPVQELQTVPMFWFNSAILIYRAGTLFLFLFTPYLVKVLNNDLLIYWSFHNILNVVHQIVLTIGLWQDLRNIKLRSLSPSVP